MKPDQAADMVEVVSASAPDFTGPSVRLGPAPTSNPAPASSSTPYLEIPSCSAPIPTSIPARAPEAAGEHKSAGSIRSSAADINLLAGSSHWTTHPIPLDDSDERLVLFLSDGPHGLRKQEGKTDHLGLAESRLATCFPTASALACSFDPELVERVGAAIGEEARDQGVDVVLGPGVNIKRHPLCGRNFEYFSEDPLVSGTLGSAMVRGIQSRGVGASLKHLAANSQEHARMVQDSVIDSRALHEVYLAPFEQVVREAHPWTVMSAYNRLNGAYCSEHPWLLQRMLRDTWGFDGAVVSDWGAASSSVASVRAGLDLCMPGPRPDYANDIARAVERGELDENIVSPRVSEIAHLASRVREGRSLPYSCDYAEHLVLAREAAARSAVLLENDGTLPLKQGASVALIGAFAAEPRYQGSGSSRINPTEIDSIAVALEERAVPVVYARGYDRATGETTGELLGQAVDAARACDVAVVVVGLPDRYESEGFDRKLMYMPRGHVRLIERVCAANPRTVVIVQGGAPMEMPWRRLPAATLLTYLAGCQGGHAAVDVLYGDVNPCGKLAETWSMRLEDTALGDSYPDMGREVLYRESIYVGYRYYDAAQVDPAYPFGYGLSYTTFDVDESRAEVMHGDEVCIELSFAIENTGDRAGAEVVQIYVAPCDRTGMREPQRLADFARVGLQPGERRLMKVGVGSRAFRMWDPLRGRWHVDPGSYELRVASSSRDVRASILIELDEAVARAMEHRENELDGIAPAGITGSANGEKMQPGCFYLDVPESYRRVSEGCFNEGDFRILYGGPLPERAPIVPFTHDSTVSDMSASWFGRRMFRLIDFIMREQVEKMDRDQRAMMSEMAADMPLRSMTMSGIPMGVVDGFVRMLNGRYLTGLRRVVRFFAAWAKERHLRA